MRAGEAIVAPAAASVANVADARGRRGWRGRGRGNRGGGQCGRGAAAREAQDEEDEERTGPPPRPSPTPSAVSLRGHLGVLTPDLVRVLRQRVHTFQSPSHQLRGLLRNAFSRPFVRPRRPQMRATSGSCSSWPRVTPAELRRRERAFVAGRWLDLLHEATTAAAPTAAASGVRPPNTRAGDVDQEKDARRRAERAAALAQLGELSAAAKALTALPLAPTTQETLQALRDPARRPPEPQVPIDPRLLSSRAPPVELSPDRLIANVRRARKGAAPGPSGCTGEHLRVLLDDEECTQLLVTAAGKLASAQVPDTIIPAIRLGRMVALTKPTGGVRALVMGDAFRRVVARTMAQQLTGEFQRACAPFRYALGIKAGAEALVRAVRAATDGPTYPGKTCCRRLQTVPSCRPSSVRGPFLWLPQRLHLL